MVTRAFALLMAIGGLLTTASPAFSRPLWLTFPDPAPMPAGIHSGRLPINGVQIWYAEFGAGPPVILLHGGLANSDYWAAQVAALARNHRVIVIDSRGHGRSTRDARPYSYELMTDDVIGMMDALHVRRAAVVGWSDGGNIGLIMAMHHPTRISRLFAFGANADPSALDAGGMNSPVIAAVLARCAADYQRLSSTPHDFVAFATAVQSMWATQPHFTDADLATIHIPVVIADGAHEEAVLRAPTEALARAIPHARLLIMPDVSHFAAIQDPAGFNAALFAFLDD